ncbi:MAG: hypothetical protein OIN66_03005 [Candidatus Methanoperedens sp.]|nr:hypothetical protein [Candidatus Methanoperedens sp.]
MEKSPDNTRSLKIIIIILSILLVGSSTLLIFNLEKVNQQEKTISALSNLTEKQKEQISQLENTTSSLQQNLSRAQEQLKNETQTRQKLERDIFNLTMVAKSEYGILAVDENNVGHLIPLEVTLKSGGGNLFLNVANVRVDETMQLSAQTAVKVAREVTGTSLFNKDILISIESTEARVIIIEGGSAGGAMTLAAIAAMQEKTIRKDVLMTGTINADHSIGPIGAAREKAIAAKENGAVLFLVPAGQKDEVGNVGIEVREVATIEDAMRYAIP